MNDPILKSVNNMNRPLSKEDIQIFKLQALTQIIQNFNQSLEKIVLDWANKNSQSGTLQVCIPDVVIKFSEIYLSEVKNIIEKI